VEVEVKSMNLKSYSKIVGSISEWVARAVSWLLIILAVIVVYEVVVRNIFNAATVWVLALSYQLYAAIFMLGAAYTLHVGAHIRIGFLWERLSPRNKAIAEMIFYLGIFFPLVGAFVVTGTDWAWDAWKHWEIEPPEVTLWMEPIYPFKTILPVAFYLLAVQGIAEFARNLLILIRGEAQ
jgi:TRAP-type mannitol/chloroaromatic compound transport system permease small subunit